jgi:hypothetical protein
MKQKRYFMKKLFCFILSLSICSVVLTAQDHMNNSPFKQITDLLPTPNSYRTASGAPGHEYFQQRADYKMNITLDDDQQRIYGEETITYHNNSPDMLSYLWLQLDQNVRAKDSDTYKVAATQLGDNPNIQTLGNLESQFDGGFKVENVTDNNGRILKYTINNTMMRVDLPSPLKTGGKYSFKIKWWYNINNTDEVGGRSGFEHFAEDGNNVYVIAQFFPRMCAYNDIEGWQNKQFLGRGEFTLIFGDYDVSISVPSDHLVASTGELLNASSVLSSSQRSRINKARDGGLEPVVIATKEEADERMSGRASSSKTWRFKADNVRDFAFASSRRFIWDALGVKMSDGRTVLAQSMWVKEGNCLWSRYSTKAVAHTIKWYSHYTFDYPYPVAWSIDGSMGMEYPMICFNYGRCNDDGTYSQRMKYGHIGVIIHEVGHNWFPMIVNSDERQWTWMDEGLNSFLQYLAEQQWERNYPSRRGPAYKITDYMGGDKSQISPIMTNSESIYQFGNNAYGKPATALNILRETVMGRELFDFAFKEYANRWKFKQPYPGDFFRTMEDASSVDLDWFWRGWFFTNDHVDQAISNVEEYNLTPLDPNMAKKQMKEVNNQEERYISNIRNSEEIVKTQDEIDPALRDFYTDYDPYAVDAIDEREYENISNSLNEKEKNLLEDNKNYYELTFENIGGLIMPIVFQFTYEDGTTEDVRLPAEIWRKNIGRVKKVFPRKKKVVRVELDPYLELADVDTSNNVYPPEKSPSKFDLFKNKRYRGNENPMQRAMRAKQLKKPFKP